MAERRQLVRELDERVIERAEADPQWKRQFVEAPLTAVGDMPEAQRLREIDESAGPTEQQLPEAAVFTPREEFRQLQRSLNEKVLDRAASDPLWKQQLLEDPEAAMREADFPELKRLAEVVQEEAQVQGHLNLMTLDPVGGRFYYYTTAGGSILRPDIYMYIYMF